MRIYFFGAAQGVTGSMHIIEVNGKRILLDCGLFQGRRKESDTLNRNLPFAPQNVDVMVLSHAHIDHSGNIPSLCKGYNGDIICTLATRDLCAVMLMDSAHIQEKDAEFFNKKIANHPSEYITPTYTAKDAEKSIKQFIGINYDRPFQLADGVKLTFLDAGHVLGSAVVVLDITENGKERRLVFSGDIGRKHIPILRDPSHVSGAEILIMESTYGNRTHDPIEVADQQLETAVNDIYKRKGKIIIPAFSLERSQEILYSLKFLLSEDRIPKIPVYVDSPLTVKVTDIFRLHPECFDDEMQLMFDSREDPFDFPELTMIRSKEASQGLNEESGPMVIIAASGMCEGGRVLHHLRNNIQDSNNMVLIVGFQAEHTLGRKIVERQARVRIFGVEHDLEAEVRVIQAYSGHADKNGLESFAMASKDTLQHTFLVHGEPESLKALQGRLDTLGFKNVNTPERGQFYDV